MANILKEKSYAFSLRMVKLYQYLSKEQKEFVLSKQVLKSGTAIGALVREAEYAQSKKDFINKLNVALKEANETEYWLLLLKDSGYLNEKMLSSVLPEIKELIKLLISSLKTAKQRNSE